MSKMNMYNNKMTVYNNKNEPIGEWEITYYDEIKRKNILKEQIDKFKILRRKLKL